VHYPWCLQKCPYCDFNSHGLSAKVVQEGQLASQALPQEAAYIEALLQQLERTLPLIWGRPIHSIFFGGGTPSLMSEAGLRHFLTQAKMLLGWRSDIEITLEANPGTVDMAKFVGFRQAGINRLSIGIQSFADEKLQALGRVHSAAEAKQAVVAARQAGFENFNLDLMFALPNQTLKQAIADVQQAIDLAPTHVSHYQLTLEPNTPFYRQPPPLPEADLAWEMQTACQQLLSEAGYQHYEVSAYAQVGFQCQHNLNYWQFGDYIGLGAGAHGKLTLPAQNRVIRTQMPAAPGSYVQMMQQLKGQPLAESVQGEVKMGRVTELSVADLGFEFMLNALRLQEPVAKSLFVVRTGVTFEQVAAKVDALVDQDLMCSDETHFGLTRKGQQFLNDVVAVFLE